MSAKGVFCQNGTNIPPHLPVMGISASEEHFCGVAFPGEGKMSFGERKRLCVFRKEEISVLEEHFCTAVLHNWGVRIFVGRMTEERNLYFCVVLSDWFMDMEFLGSEVSADEKYMMEALREAHKAAQRDEVPIGAVVVCSGRIIARAHNLTEALSDATAHAEMQAITMAAAAVGGKYLDKCTLYVTVEPCPMCAAALAWSQVKRVVYGAPDQKRGYSRFTPSLMHPKTEVKGGVMAQECGQIVTEFFKAKR